MIPDFKKIAADAFSELTKTQEQTLGEIITIGDAEHTVVFRKGWVDFSSKIDVTNGSIIVRKATGDSFVSTGFEDIIRAGSFSYRKVFVSPKGTQKES